MERVMRIKKKHVFFWGAILVFSQLILWLIDFTVESTSSINRKAITELWYIRPMILVLGLFLMAYSQYPRSRLGRVGRWIYRFILWLIKTKRSAKK